ncbi:hypothetical protein HJC23_004123 [Cyclotella cryptica]|uniref:N-acetyltransferase domain-containing protein n=1 Tax=Cyclotella cryptica TaxID=29204 RepID=A0ABD3P853_9STRA
MEIPRNIHLAPNPPHPPLLPTRHHRTPPRILPHIHPLPPTTIRSSPHHTPGRHGPTPPLRHPTPYTGRTSPLDLGHGGTHGYETSGVMGALAFLSSGRAEEYLSRLNVVVVPCVCPWGYERMERWTQKAVDPNRSFRRGDDGGKELLLRTEESLALMTFLDSIGNGDGAGVRWLCHLDLHETTDTDRSEFCPAKAARDGEVEYEDHIPDGFYLVGDSVECQLEWYRAIIEAVERVTHIADAAEDGTLVGEPVVSRGVIVVPKKKLGLCAGGAAPGAKYVVTTEVYPDSDRTNPEQCVLAQMETVCAAFDYLLENEIGKEEGITIRCAADDDFAMLNEFHVTNHLDETCHFPGEREHQLCDLQEDFPHLHSLESFRRGKFWVATADDNMLGNSNIVGCIGLLPDKDDPDKITWLNTFSVAKSKRGRKIGSRLMDAAVSAVKTDRVRLVTLGGHSEGIDVMGLARLLYEKNGFARYKSETVSYGHETTIDLLYYEKIM